MRKLTYNDTIFNHFDIHQFDIQYSEFPAPQTDFPADGGSAGVLFNCLLNLSCKYFPD
jgi:hypothetical protein